MMCISGPSVGATTRSVSTRAFRICTSTSVSSFWLRSSESPQRNLELSTPPCSWSAPAYRQNPATSCRNPRKNSLHAGNRKLNPRCSLNCRVASRSVLGNRSVPLSAEASRKKHHKTCEDDLTDHGSHLKARPAEPFLNNPSPIPKMRPEQHWFQFNSLLEDRDSPLFPSTVL